MVCKLAAFIGVSFKVLILLLLGYEGKNVLVSRSAEPVGHTELEKRQMDEAQK